MTKNEYLIELTVKVQALTDRPRAIHDELKAIISFYQEMIEDKMEDGMTEEEAVAAMEPIDDIIDRLKGEMAEGNDGEAQRGPAETEHAESACVQPHDSSERMRLEYAPGSLNRILIEDSDSGIQIRPGDTVAVNYCSNAEGHYEVTETAGVLAVKYILHKRGLFRLFSFRKKRDELMLEIPRGWNGALMARTDNGKISFEGEATDIILRTSNAKIEIISAVADKVSAVTSNGKISAEHMCCREAELTTSNARIAADDTNAGKMLKMVTSNGSISAVNVSAPKFIAHTSNGSIKVQGINSGEITIATANGSIAGTIPGRMEDYAITSKTSNGKNNLPNGTAGAKKLDVRTSNGSISVDFAG